MTDDKPKRKNQRITSRWERIAEYIVPLLLLGIAWLIQFLSAHLYEAIHAENMVLPILLVPRNGWFFIGLVLVFLSFLSIYRLRLSILSTILNVVIASHIVFMSLGQYYGNDIMIRDSYYYPSDTFHLIQYTNNRYWFEWKREVGDEWKFGYNILLRCDSLSLICEVIKRDYWRAGKAYPRAFSIESTEDRLLIRVDGFNVYEYPPVSE